MSCTLWRFCGFLVSEAFSSTLSPRNIFSHSGIHLICNKLNWLTNLRFKYWVNSKNCANFHRCSFHHMASFMIIWNWVIRCCGCYCCHCHCCLFTPFRKCHKPKGIWNRWGETNTLDNNKIKCERNHSSGQNWRKKKINTTTTCLVVAHVSNHRSKPENEVDKDRNSVQMK